MEFASYQCDVCGAVKRDTNHWFKACRVPGPRFVIIPWERTLFEPPVKEMHLCGMGCAIKAMQAAMTEAE